MMMITTNITTATITGNIVTAFLMMSGMGVSSYSGSSRIQSKKGL
jgi:hypothetical protein